MMFLLKIAFWIMLIFLLLPGSKEDNRKLVNSAEKTVEDFGSFCTRNPDVCANARSAVTSLVSRVKNGADIVEDWVAKRSDEAQQTDAASPVEPQHGRSKSQDRAPASEPRAPRAAPQWNNTLSQSDRNLSWRGPTGL